MPAIPLVRYILGGWVRFVVSFNKYGTATRLLISFIQIQDLAISGDLILQGVLFAQCAHYISLYIKDIQFLRVYVIILLIVTTLKSAQLL
jgi:hypothetical protein